MTTELTILPGLRMGNVEIPMSKSHLHRLMIADFLASRQGAGIVSSSFSIPRDYVAEDILATRQCLEALRNDKCPTLNCRESGSTLRFLMPVAMACASEAYFTAEGRLPQRPISAFLDLLTSHGVKCLSDNGQPLFPLHLRGTLQPGEFTLPGNISSQIVTGLLMALPLLHGDSSIRLISPMESRGYVDMTIQVLRAYQITIVEEDNSFHVPGNQCYCAPNGISPELDWSGAAFWIVMNYLGSQITLPQLPMESMQPDRQIENLLNQLGTTIDVSQCPDIFPVLAVAAAATPANTVFTGVRRLRLKESDRLSAMAEVLNAFGVTVLNEENRFVVFGVGAHFRGNITINPHNDHRIAMATAVAATIADGPVTIQEPQCVRKSYPDFFQQFLQLSEFVNRPS